MLFNNGNSALKLGSLLILLVGFEMRCRGYLEWWSTPIICILAVVMAFLSTRRTK